MIYFEKEICNHLSLPSIPKKEWDGKSSFKVGVAVTKLYSGEAYAACTFDADVDEKPRVTKVFAQEIFYDIGKIFVVPSYMDVDVDNADLDDESKKAAERLKQEGDELTGTNDIDIKEMQKLPEWVFDHIHNMEEARAFLISYNQKHKIRGKVPANEETIKLRLLTIYNEMKK